MGYEGLSNDQKSNKEIIYLHRQTIGNGKKHMCTKIEWSKKEKNIWWCDEPNKYPRGFKTAHNGVLPDLATTDKNKYK